MAVLPCRKGKRPMLLVYGNLCLFLARLLIRTPERGVHSFSLHGRDGLSHALPNRRRRRRRRRRRQQQQEGRCVLIGRAARTSDIGRAECRAAALVGSGQSFALFSSSLSSGGVAAAEHGRPERDCIPIGVERLCAEIRDGGGIVVVDDGGGGGGSFASSSSLSGARKFGPFPPDANDIFQCLRDVAEYESPASPPPPDVGDDDDDDEDDDHDHDHDERRSPRTPPPLPATAKPTIPLSWYSSVLGAIADAASKLADDADNDDGWVGAAATAAAAGAPLSGIDRCVRVAEAIMTRMIFDGCRNDDDDDDDAKLLPPPPDVDCYNCLLSILASSARRGGDDGAASARRAAWYVRAMERGRSPLPPTPTPTPTLDSTANVADGEHSNARPLYQPTPPRPNAATYTHLVNAWAVSGDDKALQRITSMCRSLDQYYDATNDESIRPNTAFYNAILLAYSKVEVVGSLHTNSKRGSRRRGGGRNGRGGDDSIAIKAEATLAEMWRLHDEGSMPNVKPNTDTYNRVMDTWAESRSDASPGKIQALLNQMKTRMIQPNVESYNALINSHSKSDDYDAPARAEQVLRTMSMQGDIVPNTRSYNKVLAAYARPPSVGGSAETAAHLFSEMEDEPSLQPPDVRSYTTLISAWARSYAPDKAERALSVLSRMEANANARISQSGGGSGAGGAVGNIANGRKLLSPEVAAYNAALNACAFSGPYETRPESCRRPFAIAISIFNKLCSHENDGVGGGSGSVGVVAPNHVTYGTLLKCCANLLPSYLNDGDGDGYGDYIDADGGGAERMASLHGLRERVVERTFRKCCGDGLVGDLVLANLKLVASPKLYRRLLEDIDINVDVDVDVNVRDAPRKRIKRDRERGRVRVSDLPPEWTRNVKEGKGYRGRRT